VSSSAFIPGFTLVLASQSPRRSELLRQAGFAFVTRPSHIAEERKANESARNYVARLAAEKAKAIEHTPSEGVLGADTTVAVIDDGIERILEKPVDASDAHDMLRLLSGRTHSVYTGICFCWQSMVWVDVEHTLVKFSEMSEHDISVYVASGEPFDKAGAYGIQGLASKYISRIEGCYYNVVGLPIHRVHAMLDQAGVLLKA
jgi:septum formation protein